MTQMVGPTFPTVQLDSVSSDPSVPAKWSLLSNPTPPIWNAGFQTIPPMTSSGLTFQT